MLLVVVVVMVRGWTMYASWVRCVVWEMRILWMDRRIYHVGAGAVGYLASCCNSVKWMAGVGARRIGTGLACVVVVEPRC